MAHVFGTSSPNTTWRNRDGADGHDGGNAAACQKLPGPRQRREPIAKQMRDGILGDVAEQDGRQRDAELRRREEAIQLPERLAHGCALLRSPRRIMASIACGGTLRAPNSAATKKALAATKRDDGQQAQTEAVHGLIVLDLRRGHIRAAR